MKRLKWNLKLGFKHCNISVWMLGAQSAAEGYGSPGQPSCPEWAPRVGAGEKRPVHEAAAGAAAEASAWGEPAETPPGDWNAAKDSQSQGRAKQHELSMIKSSCFNKQTKGVSVWLGGKCQKMPKLHFSAKQQVVLYKNFLCLVFWISFSISYVTQTAPGLTCKWSRTKVFSWTRVCLFSLHQSSDEISHLFE